MNDVKNEFILIQARGGLISGGGAYTRGGLISGGRISEGDLYPGGRMYSVCR